MEKHVLAIDFGASSGRAILGSYKEGSLSLKEVHRFVNQPVQTEESLTWNIPFLFEQILTGIKKALKIAPIDSIGIDTWGVDFGLIDSEGQLLENPYHYRDSRTSGMVQEVEKFISGEELYTRTGNQIMEINTLFQLYAMKQQNPGTLKKAKTLLLMPDLFNYLLTGEKAAEKSIASTTQMINSASGEWDRALLNRLGLPTDILPDLVKEGTILGYTKPELGVGKIPVINVCSHDTGSAVASVPSNQKFLFVSCGTWSLVGTELDMPVRNEQARFYNLTNESGINGTVRFLKNCTGLWIIQELKRNFSEKQTNYSYQEISKMSMTAAPFKCLIDTDDPVFSTPGDMITRIQEYAKDTQQPIPDTPQELFRCAYESLAFKYKYTFLEITDALNREFDNVNIIGGGAQAEILCQMVADASNMTVGAGPVEATATGNILVQLIKLGVVNSIEEGRQWIKELTDMHYYFPKNVKGWDEQFTRYEKISKKSKGA